MLRMIPTPLRLDADATRTGRGVTVAFLDSGFYLHPDLTQPVNRIQPATTQVDSTDMGALL